MAILLTSERNTARRWARSGRNKTSCKLTNLKKPNLIKDIIQEESKLRYHQILSLILVRNWVYSLTFDDNNQCSLLLPIAIFLLRLLKLKMIFLVIERYDYTVIACLWRISIWRQIMVINGELAVSE